MWCHERYGPNDLLTKAISINVKGRVSALSFLSASLLEIRVFCELYGSYLPQNTMALQGRFRGCVLKHDQSDGSIREPIKDIK